MRLFWKEGKIENLLSEAKEIQNRFKNKGTRNSQNRDKFFEFFHLIILAYFVVKAFSDTLP